MRGGGRERDRKRGSDIGDDKPHQPTYLEWKGERDNKFHHKINTYQKRNTDVEKNQ